MKNLTRTEPTQNTASPLTASPLRVGEILTDIQSALAPMPKAKRLGPVDRSSHPRNQRRLTDNQRQKTLLGRAAERVREEATNRECKYLRPFDARAESCYRTNQRRWDSLSLAIEPLLTRLDFATMQLGYINKKTKQFYVNRQRGIAEDSCLQEWTLSRLMRDLASVGYISRKARRIRQYGGWITRTTIKIRDSFFSDLGLGPALAKLRVFKKEQRRKEEVKASLRSGALKPDAVRSAAGAAAAAHILSSRPQPQVPPNNVRTDEQMRAGTSALATIKALLSKR